MVSFALEAWVLPLRPRFEGDRLLLLCPTVFHRDRVRERYLALISRHLEAERGRPVEVELAVAPPQKAGPRAARRRQAEPAARPAPRAVARREPVPRQAAAASQPALPYRFETFVVGPCNALAREASFALARGGQRGLNPLFLSADAGLGKTHLARAIATAVREQGSQRVIYASAESFTNDFMTAIRGKQMEGFKRRYREGCRVLVLEDVQFLRAKRATQLELFHTLSHLLDVGARVVLSGDRLPRDMEGLDPRLRSQLSAGLVAELEPPDALVRREILRQKAASGGVRLPDDCRELIVESVRGNVRDLEGVLIQLVATASLLKRPIDEELTKAALHKLQPDPEAQRLDPSQVLEAVAAFFRTRPETLAGRSRRRDVLWPRQLTMYLCTRYTDAPQSAIARLLGREHTAVRNAVRVVERTLLEHAPRRYQVEALSARLDALRRGAA
jgi:chromosomal replication initiator protein